jgi:hypothetical protein
MNKFTLEQTLMHVNNVKNPSVCPVIFKDTQKLTVVKNPMYVSSVEKLLVLPVT